MSFSTPTFGLPRLTNSSRSVDALVHRSAFQCVPRSRRPTCFVSSGDLRALGLAPAQRRIIFRAQLRLIDDLHARAFAVVVDKRGTHRPPAAYFDLAWEGLLQLLVDDPVPRRSHQSYFVQLADLVAYSGFRAFVPPGTSIGAVCPADMWDELGAATHTAVSGLRPRSRPGIVVR